ncbi:transcriptional regulator [Komagataeibacter xylinus NBRC 13693]|uniref:Transcriptional regulator n=1 Tax=Komagataeibacter xylinus NBRC 13693 TaxID=1234668 RepID=A0A0D6QD83_KOMXY|nr:transcriptional regulator [Komagataeibacter xylinus NBRC 13693]
MENRATSPHRSNRSRPGRGGQQTIYRCYPSKENLFKTVIAELGNSFQLAASPSKEMVSNDLLQALYKTMRMLLDLILSPEPHLHR